MVEKVAESPVGTARKAAALGKYLWKVPRAMPNINTKKLRIETSVARPNVIQIFRGENVPIELHFVNYGQTINLTGYTVEAYYQSPNMGQNWYKDETHLTVSGDTVTWTWTPDIDPGAERYRWFVRVYGGDANDSYKAFGDIEMLASPAHNEIQPLPVPPIPIDCSKYEWLNAPWLTLEDAETIQQGIEGRLDDIEEVIPSAASSANQLADKAWVARVVPDVVAPTTAASGEGKAADAMRTGLALAAKFDVSGGTVTGDTVFTQRLESRSYLDFAAYAPEGIEYGRIDQGFDFLAFPSVGGTIATEDYVAEQITQGTAIYRGNYPTKAALLAVNWQTTNPDAPNFVSNNDYAVVLADESQDGGCWRYIYVIDGQTSEWEAQYEINESPLTQAQLDALNSGATSANIASIADKLDAANDYTRLSLATPNVGLNVGDTAGVYRASYRPNGIVHNWSDGVDHTLTYPAKNGLIAVMEDVESAVSALSGTNIVCGGDYEWAVAPVTVILGDIMATQIPNIERSVSSMASVIPVAATSANQLADKAWVDTAISATVGDIDAVLDAINGEVI